METQAADRERRRRRRVLWISALNGWSVAVLGGLCVLTSLAFFSWPGIVVGVGILAAGWVELTGRKRLKAGLGGAEKWLTRAQLLLFGVIACYAAWQLLSFNGDELMRRLPREVREQLTEALGASPQELDALVVRVHHTIYVALILASFLCQGGLWLFYRRSVRRLEAPSASRPISRGRC